MRVDGGLATTLQQRHGLDPFTPVNAWIRERPDALVDVHHAFVEAGADIVLAGTFMLWPEREPDWSALTVQAVGLALTGVAGRSAVWASLGPCEPEGAARVAARAIAAGAVGVALESAVDVEQLERTVRQVRAVTRLPIAASVNPRADGLCWDGTPPDQALRRLAAAGATAVGFNCGDGPDALERCLSAAGDPGVPLWACPSAGDLRGEALRELLGRLDGRCAFVGGCCGVGPEGL